MKNKAARIFMCILLSLLLVSSPAFADDSPQSNLSLDEVEAEILTDLIPDHLLSDTQRHITREEFSTVLINLYEKLTNSNVEASGSTPFTDTDNPDVLKAYSLGIVEGVGNGKFNPKEKLTIQEKAKMLYNTMVKIDPSIDDDIKHDLDFDDEDHISSWAEEAIGFLIYHGILTVDDSNRVNPSTSVTTQLVAITVQETVQNYWGIYGGFIEDTTILTAERIIPIKYIKIGDIIITSEGNQARICNIWKQPVDGVFQIRTKLGKHNNLSRDSQILTEKGFVKAADLRTSDIVITSSGREEVESIYLDVNYHRSVYQLMLEELPDSEGIVVNGMVLGVMK